MNLQTRQSNVPHSKHLLKFDCFAFTCPYHLAWIIIMYSFIEKKERERETGREGRRNKGREDVQVRKDQLTKRRP